MQYFNNSRSVFPINCFPLSILIQKYYSKFSLHLLAVTLILLTTAPSDIMSQWVKMSGGMAEDKVIWALTNSNSAIFAATQDSGIFRSTDKGTNWVHVNDIPLGQSLTVYADGINIYAGRTANGVYISSDNGVNWVHSFNGLTSYTPGAFIVKDQFVFAGIYGEMIYRSSNNGTNWIPLTLSTNYFWEGFAILGNDLFACANNVPGVFKSTNNGLNWVAVGIGSSNPGVFDLAVQGTDLYAGTTGGVYRTTNMGDNWIYLNQGFTGNARAVYISGNNLLTGGTNGFFRSADKGTNWTLLNQGLSTLYILSLTADNEYIYAGTSGGSIFRRPLSEIITTSVQSISTEIPDNYSLNQNYPNPFNPVTNIEFSIPRQSNVNITVYDSQGKKMTSLLDQRLSAGKYNVTFDGRDYSSGIYFFKMEAENFVKSRSMIILK